MGEFAAKKLFVLIFLTIMTLVIIMTTMQIAGEISNILGLRFSDMQTTTLLSLIYSSLFYRTNFNYEYRIENTGNVKYTVSHFFPMLCINSQFVVTTEDCLTIPIKRLNVRIKESANEIVFLIEKKWS
ncbi:MAG: hypothetical protein RMJ17_01410 [Candidatus Aenigmarchaeota archaeon]|nr:hypothetical protein [Candidatus Aenigmarchaeota archaeon]MDW8149238.1 hypothetical protein [Candidatus Aenigmarchaeota archaeon]